MLNIVCVKWGTKYPSDYVNKLYKAVSRNTSVPFLFHCFTDNGDGLSEEVIVHPLPFRRITGWWHKLYLFSRDINIPVGERIFFLDLDTIIVNNLDSILSNNEEGFIALRDFYHGDHTGKKRDDTIGSAVMQWEAGTNHQVWDNFEGNYDLVVKMLKNAGDQMWIQLQIPNKKYWQDLFPNKIKSFKLHNKNILQDSSIICFHGRPSIPDAAMFDNNTELGRIPAQKWIWEHWKN